MDPQKPKRSVIGWCIYILAGFSAVTGLTGAVVTIVLGQAALCRMGAPLLDATGWQPGQQHCAEVIAADGKTKQMLEAQSKLIAKMKAQLDKLAAKDQPPETPVPPAEDTQRRDEAVTDLAQDPAPAAQDAAQAIADGDIERAATLLRDQATAAVSNAICDWRRLGALLYNVDTARALEAYREAVKLGSDDAWDGIYLGRLYVRAGDLGMAREAFETALSKLPHEQERNRSVLFNELGNVQRAQGDLAGALESYRASLAIREALAAQDPGNAGWQRDLGVSYWRMALTEGTGVTWRQVADQWQAMADRGILFPPDRRWLAEAQRRAEAEAQQ